MNTAIHTHVLSGCATQPLGAYLKAMGILRIVAEQADPEARGYWRHDGFILQTVLDRDALMGFFLNDWQPNPFLSPWNKGSGLLGTDKKGVEPLEQSIAPRFQRIRDGIAVTRSLTADMEAAVAAEKEVKGEKTQIKDKAGKAALDADPEYKARLRSAAKRCKRLKDDLQPECQRRFRGPALAWLRAALVLSADGKAVFPAMLGTGGNDGKLDFTNNAMQRLGTLFDLASPVGAPTNGAATALASALYGDTERAIINGAIGQFTPGGSGGPNGTSGPLGPSGLNPWDLPLLLEGALFFSASSSRRLGAVSHERVVAPFSTRSVAAGYASAALSDEGSRGEQWFPLWSRPASASEVLALLIEGRAQLKSGPTETSLDMARAIARLGVARGITAFERYGYIERNGKSNYAVPLGRWEVHADQRATLLDDLEQGDWWGRVRRACRDSQAPASMAILERRLAETALDALAHSGDPRRWQDVLLALASLEARLVESGNFTVKARLQPLPPLRAEWLDCLGDTAELRLALSLATSGESETRDGHIIDGIRHNYLPIDRFGRFVVREKALAHDPRVVMTGRDATQDLIRLIQRRTIEARTNATKRQHASAAGFLPLVGLRGFEAHPADLALLISGALDLTRILGLARGLAALDASSLARHARLRRPAGRVTDLDAVWCSLRLAHITRPLADGRRFTLDAAIVRALAAGDLPRAFEVARQRLSGGGIRLSIQAATGNRETAQRYAASLAFPIAPSVAETIAHFLYPQGRA